MTTSDRIENPAPAEHIYPALTGLRWVAAFCVWLHHFPPPVPMPDWVRRWILELHIGVPVFFVLSGFLITLRYSESAAIDRRLLGRYALNRFARIYPVYFLVTTMAVVVVPLFHGERVDGTVLMLNLTLLRGFFEEYKFTGVPQGWTLTVEECFYFSAPLFFLFWRRAARGLGITLAGIYAAGLVLWWLGGKLDFHGLFTPFRFVAYYTFFGHGFSFIAGAWLARRFLAGKQPVPRGRFPRLTIGGGLGIFLGVLVLSWGQTDVYLNGIFNPAFALVYFFVIPAAVCVLIAGLATEKGWPIRLLGSRPLVLLGKASYSFYLIHMGFTQTFLHRLLPKALKADRYWFEFLGIVLLSIALYLWVEKPLNRRLRRLGRKSPPS